MTDVVKYATEGTLKNLELKVLRNNQPDIAAFDFTSIKKAEHAARIIERKGSKLLVALVGDSLLEVWVWLILKCALSRILVIMLCYPLPSWEFSEIMKQSNNLK